ncbi:monocarboxylate transporter 12-like [Ylistrum balloti]|uniref:monocarboxylate transporter 12-like n=1 Tax=Ylistrum balloti TaxID=509963 RepID=UPI002905A177|nr:monocarboxylate transporter 12-like [Ylistrum balloti]XP_060063890.1 monocarboxylate transporter 12-like [Ylistrum balloti]XP_060063891.1 monocarboxylate transporter 12-like [Ylistrum balloti]
MPRTEKWTVLISGFLTIFLGTSLGYSSGVIHVALLEKYNKSNLLTAWVGSLFSSMFCLGAPLGSALVNNFSCRACVIMGGSLNMVGFALACFVPKFEFLFFSYGILAGLGQSFSNIGAVVSIGYFFKKQRTLATGTILVGTGLGIVIFPPLIRIFIDHYGLDGAFLMLGGISFQTCVFGALLRPHKMEIMRQQALSKQEGDVRQLLKLTYICSSVTDYLSLFNNTGFVFMCLSILCWSSGINSCTLLLPDFYVSTGSSSNEGAYLMSLFGIGSTLSRILTGMAAVEGGIDGKLIYFGSWGIVGVLTLCFPAMAKAFTGKVIYALLLGLYSAGTFVLLSQIAVDIVGLDRFASAVGMELFVCGVGFLIGPIIASEIVSVGGYLHTFLFLGCLFVLASVLGVVTISFIPKDIQKVHKDVVVENTDDSPEENPFIVDPV